VNGALKLNESFNARMMVEDHGEEIRYCGPWKVWLIWDGRVWSADKTNRIYALAEETLVLMRKKAALLPVKDEVYQMMDHAGRSESTHKIESMVKGASWKHGVSLLPEELDSDNWLFNCANGILDCRCGRLAEHDRGALMTMMSPVAYDADARCPQWKQFLKTVFRGDSQLIRFVQKAIGTCLTGDTSVQSMFILYGTGANGKSTFVNTIMAVLGDYAATTPTETFLSRKGDQANNDIARLKGKRFVSAMESELGGRLAEAMVKRLTGNDVISARFLYGEYFDFIPTFKIFMATNHKPKVGGMDEAIWRRLKLIPFEVSIPPEKQDRHLKEKLERELPGILSWMVEGCLLWLNEGLGHVEAVDEAVREYRGQMSSIEAFLEAECVRDDYGRVKIGVLYDRFVSWCEATNERVISKRALGMRLDEMGVPKCRDADCWYRVGWRINN
jgi:putative DNA primase/helicase